MTAPERGLLIGDFARPSRLPVSTLRYYAQIGLLTPAVVDPGSGYRRYTLEQLDAAVLIARLRAIGITRQIIARVLAVGASAQGALVPLTPTLKPDWSHSGVERLARNGFTSAAILLVSPGVLTAVDEGLIVRVGGGQWDADLDSALSVAQQPTG